MGKFYDDIGFASTEETSPTVWEEIITPKKYRGDILENYKRYENGQKVNDDLVLNAKISIIADPFAFGNLGNIRYVKMMGSSWKVTNVDVKRPRLILTIGGLYNGK